MALTKALKQLNPLLAQEIEANSQVMTIEANTELLHEGQYVKVIPLVISGLIKVYTRQEDRELLLYYIQPDESCIMSFSASIENEPSRIYAKTEETSEILLIPTSKIPIWRSSYPDFNTLFFKQFNQRYVDLLDTINHLLFHKMDQRLHNYLQEKAKITSKNPIKISHKQIANEIGTVREVVTRVLKKLESEGKIIQSDNHIEIF
ncbi:MAG: Crp/Fnr family transcriptional regulator [Flammeovirgaceae bacterium]|nr:Crp/Fnr family transcriptional regulator [Flammeovirgaceae bacterium]MBE63320.1 Crp/Fnr family transcriptional regulator [Flammeovirgaceae bacterium]HCX23539.1 Crp/Fnr family transcriptional regulator [Cytophagales bacterium]|tara:strand:- start:2629 stop:3243 length:615 start_codon:yes stop_codon:yes gene_type:complete